YESEMRSRDDLRRQARIFPLANDAARGEPPREILIRLNSMTEWISEATGRLSPRSTMRPRPSLGWSLLPKLVKEPERLPGPLSPYGARKGDGRGGKVMGEGFVGIDVSKDWLDVAFRPGGEHLQVGNDPP